MGTVAVPFAEDSPKLANPNVVKCVVGTDNRALYFSRAPIPYARNPRTARTQPLHHWGIYLYRRRFLEQFVTWPQGELERCESLEQLRAVERGVGIHVHITQVSTIGVDTPDDLVEAEAAMQAALRAGGGRN
jgi:3-deoxy-manno-octulosonate cytidylyltransferase (CMP-KDO synthetase)